MRRLLTVTALLIMPVISACSNSGNERTAEDSKVTETRMDDIDKIEGTISDEMIDTTESTQPAPLAGKEAEADKDEKSDSSK